MVRRNLAGFGGALGLATVLAAACSSESNGVAGDAGGGDDASMPVGVSDAATAADVVYERTPYDGTTGTSVPRVPVYAAVVSNRVDTQSLLFAAGEMQISGEPFASGFAGRNLGDYDRNYIPPDQYILDNGGDDPVPITDLFGFSTAVESYEYSKYYMNMVIQESTAGVSLSSGPLVARRAETSPLARLRGRMAEILTNAGTDVGGLATLPAPTNNPQNYLGFPGQWPAFLPFADWDPFMNPTLAVVQSCTFQGGYGGVGFGTSISPLYECAYNTVHLADRESQVHKVLTPAVLGMATWKQAIWAIDFAGRIHSTGNVQVNAVAPSDVPLVGTPGNQVVATDPPGAATGTYIGSSPLEGMWGLTMLENMDNEAAWLLGAAVTATGTALGGAFATTKAALAYDYGSPLVWFPASLTVTEDTTPVPYPVLQSVAITDASSRSIDLSSLLLGHAMLFGTSDPRNAGVGQRIGFQCVYDGSPFPADDGIADGEDTLHDRTLAVLRVAFVDLDRVHSDPATGVLVDTATVTGGQISRGTTVSTPTLAHAVIALRQTVLSLNGTISQYGAPDPSPTADLQGILNPLPFTPPAGAALDGGAAPLFSQRVRQVFVANAAFVRDMLTKADGTVANGATLAGGKATPTTDATTLESQTSALRALTEGFLMTADESYRTRARAVLARLASDFYAPGARLFRQKAGGPDSVDMTPERFAWLQSALRETHKTLQVPGDPNLDRAVLEDRIARVNKLFLNGWDDLNGDKTVDKPGECLGGRLQMGEQALTGELGRDGVGRPTDDRDGDCVIEIAHSRSASVLASDVLFTTTPIAPPADAGSD
jgi:hypothetical protein